MSTTTPKPEIGRLTLTLTAKTIRELRLLAALLDQDQHAIVEELFLKAGLTTSVEAALNRESARSVQELPLSPVPDPYREHGLSQIEVPPSANQQVPLQTGATDDDIPW